MNKPCTRCGKPERRENDSMCRSCRNEYVRLWKAKRRHGPTLKGYNPTGARSVLRPSYKPKRRVTATPPVGK